ncbi:MAG: hypothetical protein RhofKO_25640 [Rhodothermales bacterium]
MAILQTLPIGTATLFIGNTAPDSGTGFDGDTYLDTITGTVYEKASGSWTANSPVGDSILFALGGTTWSEVKTTAQAQSDEPLQLRPGTYIVDANITLSTICSGIVMMPGAVLKPDSGVTITIDVPFEAANTQCFEIDASHTTPPDFVFTPGVTTAMNPKWWGAQGDGSTDDTVALQAAIDAAEVANGFTYEKYGGYDLGSYDVHLPPGMYLHKTLIVQATSLIGSGADNTFLKHDFVASTSENALKLGSTTTPPSGVYYDIWIRHLSVVGDGDLDKDGGTNNTKVGILAARIVYMCGFENVTISQCAVGIQANSCWTLRGASLFIYNCEEACLDWTGAIAGVFDSCRFEGFYRDDSGTEIGGNAVVCSYDTAATVGVEAVAFKSCTFQNARYSGLLLKGVHTALIDSCFFERNNRCDDGYGYVQAESSTAVPRSLSVSNSAFTPKDLGLTTSVAIAAGTTKSVVLVGGNIRDSVDTFAHSITSADGCEAVVSLGLQDLTANQTDLHEDTRFHDINVIPTFDEEIRLRGADGSEDFKIRASGSQLLFQSLGTGTPIAFSWRESTGFNMREYPVHNMDTLKLNKLTAPPTATDGTIAYADGATWNPGSGEGIYVAIGGTWTKMS